MAIALRRPSLFLTPPPPPLSPHFVLGTQKKNTRRRLPWLARSRLATLLPTNSAALCSRQARVARGWGGRQACAGCVRPEDQALSPLGLAPSRESSCKPFSRNRGSGFGHTLFFEQKQRGGLVGDKSDREQNTKRRRFLSSVGGERACVVPTLSPLSSKRYHVAPTQLRRGVGVEVREGESLPAHSFVRHSLPPHSRRVARAAFLTPHTHTLHPHKDACPASLGSRRRGAPPRRRVVTHPMPRAAPTPRHTPYHVRRPGEAGCRRLGVGGCRVPWRAGRRRLPAERRRV